jgi:hypothetical protein
MNSDVVFGKKHLNAFMFWKLESSYSYARKHKLSMSLTLLGLEIAHSKMLQIYKFLLVIKYGTGLYLVKMAHHTKNDCLYYFWQVRILIFGLPSSSTYLYGESESRYRSTTTEIIKLLGIFERETA